MPFEIDTQIFVGKIKMFRYLNGWSHKKMGKILGVFGTTISSWETQKSIPRIDYDVKIMTFLKNLKFQCKLIQQISAIF